MDDEPPLDSRVAAEPHTVQPKFNVKIKLGVEVRGSRMFDSPFYDQDIQGMHAIDSASFVPPWTLKEFKRVLKLPHCLALFAEHEHKVVGYAVYELQRGRLEIVRLAVQPDYRRQGVGAQLVHKMLCKLTPQRRKAVYVVVPDDNTSAHLFLQRCGFRATDVRNKYFEPPLGDAYVFARGTLDCEMSFRKGHYAEMVRLDKEGDDRLGFVV